MVRPRLVIVLFIHIMNDESKGLLLPHGIEVVIIARSNARLIILLKFNVAVGSSRPALELIAFAGSEFRGIIRNSDQAICGSGITRLGLVITEVGMIGHGDRTGYGSIVRVQGGITLHDDIHAGVILGTGAILIRRPIGKDLIALLRIGIRNASLGVHRIAVAIRKRSASATVQIVGQLINDTREYRRNGRALIQRLIHIHTIAFGINPFDQSKIIVRNEG